MSSATIITKYLPGENLLGARVTATAKNGSVTVAWNPRLTADQNHANAAKRLAEKSGWDGCWYGRPSYNGQAAVYVQINRHSTPAFIVAPAEQNSLKLVPR
jgi:hypothetical protein